MICWETFAGSSRAELAPTLGFIVGFSRVELAPTLGFIVGFSRVELAPTLGIAAEFFARLKDARAFDQTFVC